MHEVKKIDVALQGGGAHGSYSWVVIGRLLDEPRIEIDGIFGTSAGAMNDFCKFYGLSKGRRNLAKHISVKFWHKVSEAGKNSILQPIWFDKALSDGNIDFSPFYKSFCATTETLSPKQFNLF